MKSGGRVCSHFFGIQCTAVNHELPEYHISLYMRINTMAFHGRSMVLGLLGRKVHTSVIVCFILAHVFEKMHGSCSTWNNRWFIPPPIFLGTRSPPKPFCDSGFCLATSTKWVFFVSRLDHIRVHSISVQSGHSNRLLLLVLGWGPDNLKCWIVFRIGLILMHS